MLNLRKLFFVVLFLSVVTPFAFAQDDPPAVASSGAVPMIAQQSLANLPAGEKFSSLDGRFTIALPRSIDGHSASPPTRNALKASGGSYQWVIREGVIAIEYLKYTGGTSISSEQDYVDFFAGARYAIAEALKLKITSETPIKLGTHRGIKFDFRLPSGVPGSSRIFWADGTQYSLIAIYNPKTPQAEKFVAQAFDSLALISPETIDAELKRKLEEATPRPLPQTPVAAKHKSDAEDDNLKGKVKSILTESEDLSGTWSTQGRHNSSIQDFNEQGNYTRQIRYDSKANPSAVEVYGYVDGSRVSSTGMISYSYDPPPMAMPAAAGKKVIAALPLYQYKYDYKYVDGKMSEKQLFHNDGSKATRYVYNRKGVQIEELVYTEEGELNQKYLTTLDPNGNEIEMTNFDIFPDKLYGDRKYTYTYDSIDEHGNWTKQTTSKIVTENGRQISKPWSITYRTISYYP